MGRTLRGEVKVKMNFWQFCDKHYDGIWILAVGVQIAFSFCVAAIADSRKK